MNQPTEEQVVQLIRTLADRPQPGPDYFGRLREQILANLNGPEDPKTLSLLERLGVRFDLSPAVVGVVAVAMVGLLAGGILVALKQGPLYPAKGVSGLPELQVVNPGWVGWPESVQAAEPRPAPRPEAVPRSTEPVTTLDAGPLPEPSAPLEPVSYRGAKPH